MSNLLEDSFVEIRCCDGSVGYVNARPFTQEVSRRFAEIQQRLGAAWAQDPVAQAIVADPDCYGPPPDGTPILFSCNTCGAHFAWAGGLPKRVSSS